MLTAIETKATKSANRQVVLDEDLPDNAPDRVRVIVLYDEVETNGGSKKRRKAGSAEGLIKLSDDFHAPLEGFEDYQPAGNEDFDSLTMAPKITYLVGRESLTHKIR